MSRKTRKLIWSAPLVAVLAVAGVLAMFVALQPGSVFANPLPDAPSNLTAEAASGDAGRTTLVLDWDAPAGGNVSGYRIDMSNRGGVWETLVMDTTSTATTYMDDTLTAEDTRWYRVFAVNDHGVGPVSNAASGTADDKVNPGSVMNLRAVPNAKNPYNHIDLSWNPPAENGGEMIVGYEIQNHVGGLWVAIGGMDEDQATVTTKTSVTDMAEDTDDPQLDPGDSRRYRVRAVNGTEELDEGPDVDISAAGDSSEKWTTVTGTTQAASAPGQVTGLTAVNVDLDTINLYWYDPENTGGLDITAYLIQARREGQFFPSIPTELSVVDDPAETNLGGEENPNNINRFMVKPMAGLVQAMFDTTAIDPDGDGDKPASQVKWYFRVYALTFDDGKNDADTDDDVIRRSKSASNIASEVGEARLIAYDHDDDDGDGTDDTTAPINVDPLAAPGIAPTTGMDAKKQQIDLVLTVDNTLTAPDPDVEQIAYRIDYSNDLGLTWKRLEPETGFTEFGPGKPYADDDDLGFDESRSYRVFAIGKHPFTDVGLPSPLMTGMTATSEIPDKPTGLRASAPSLTSIEASWTAPRDNGGQDIVKYYYQYAPDDLDDVAEALDFGTGTVDRTTDDASTMGTFKLTASLSPETVYVFRVAAVNKDADGEDRPVSAMAQGADAPKWSDPVLFNTTEAAKPMAVEGLTSEAATDASGTLTGVNLLWNKPSDEIAIDRYEIEVQDDEGDWLNPTGGENWRASRTSYTDSDEPEADEVRNYRVRAVNMVGDGPWTMVDYPRDPAAHADHMLGDASGLTGPVSGTDVNLSWTAGANAQFHRVFGIRENADGSLDYSDIIWQATGATGSATVDMTGKASGTWQFFVIAGRGTSADDSDAVWSASWSPVHKVTY